MTLEQQARDLMERAGWEGAQELSAGDLVEVAGLIRCLRQAEDVVFNLQTGDCWCGKGIGNPMLRDHTSACQEAAAMAAELATQVRYLDNAAATFSWEAQPDEVVEAHADWLDSEKASDEMRELSTLLPPWGWFMLTDDEVPMESRYQILSYGRAVEEDGEPVEPHWTVMVLRYSIITCEPMWRVSGIDPDTLVRANTPEEAREELGAGEVAHYERRREMAMARLHAETAGNEEDDGEEG